MSWTVSGEVTKEDAINQIQKFQNIPELGEGASYQLLKAKEYAIEVISSGAVRGEIFGVSLSGHSQADSSGSPDAISISISART